MAHTFIFVRTRVAFLSGILVAVELLGRVITMFNTSRNSKLFSKVTTPFHNPTGSYEGSKFSSSALQISCLFLTLVTLMGGNWRHAVVSICIFSVTTDDEYLIGHVCIFFGEMFIPIHCPFLNFSIFIIEL